MGGVYIQIHQYFTKAQGSDLCDFGNVLVVLKILKVRVLGKDDKKLVRSHWKTLYKRASTFDLRPHEKFREAWWKVFGLDEKFLDLMKSLRWKKLEFPLPLRVPAQYPWKFWRRQYSIGSFIEWSKLKTLSRTKLKSQHLCRLSIFVVVVGVMVVVVIDFVGLEWLTVKVRGGCWRTVTALTVLLHLQIYPPRYLQKVFNESIFQRYPPKKNIT